MWWLYPSLFLSVIIIDVVPEADSLTSTTNSLSLSFSQQLPRTRVSPLRNSKRVRTSIHTTISKLNLKGRTNRKDNCTRRREGWGRGSRRFTQIEGTGRNEYCENAEALAEGPCGAGLKRIGIRKIAAKRRKRRKRESGKR